MDVLVEAFAVMGFIISIVALSFAVQTKNRVDKLEASRSAGSGGAEQRG